VVLMRVLLGLEPDRELGVLKAHTRELPEWSEGLVLENVRALGKTWAVRVEDGAVTVEETATAPVRR
jgi:hypothetical protein